MFVDVEEVVAAVVGLFADRTAVRFLALVSRSGFWFRRRELSILLLNNLRQNRTLLSQKDVCIQKDVLPQENTSGCHCSSGQPVCRPRRSLLSCPGFASRVLAQGNIVSTFRGLVLYTFRVLLLCTFRTLYEQSGFWFRARSAEPLQQWSACLQTAPQSAFLPCRGFRDWGSILRKVSCFTRCRFHGFICTVHY